MEHNYSKILLENLMCLKCGSSLSFNKTFICNSCNSEYPLLHGIPIFVDDREQYITNMFSIYLQFLNSKEDELKKLKESFHVKKWRNEYYQKLTTAIIENNQLLYGIVKLLNTEVNPTQLLKEKNMISIPTVLKDFQYLQRDWCWLVSGENQLKEICSVLDEVVSEINDKSTALMIGSGLGRIAFEQSKHYETIYATDLSFSMLTFLNRLMNGEYIQFNEINYNNIFNIDDVSRKLTATLGKAKEIKHQNLFFYASNVLKSPLKNSSLAVIYSVYFTDVLSPKLLVSEIHRLLKEDGVFIHFGPLGYGFGDVSEQLSAEEIKRYVEDIGFELVSQKEVVTNHLESKMSMLTFQFRNWLAVFKKKKSLDLNISSSSRLKTCGSPVFRIDGTIDETHVDSIKLCRDDGEEFAINEIELELIKFLYNEHNLKEVINYINDLYEVKNETSFLDVLKNLIRLNIIAILH